MDRRTSSFRATDLPAVSTPNPEHTRPFQNPDISQDRTYNAAYRPNPFSRWVRYHGNFPDAPLGEALTIAPHQMHILPQEQAREQGLFERTHSTHSLHPREATPTAFTRPVPFDTPRSQTPAPPSLQHEMPLRRSQTPAPSMQRIHERSAFTRPVPFDTPRSQTPAPPSLQHEMPLRRSQTPAPSTQRTHERSAFTLHPPERSAFTLHPPERSASVRPTQTVPFVEGSPRRTSHRDVYPSAPPAENTTASSSSRPLDRPPTTRKDTSDAPQSPHHGYSLDRLKNGLATKDSWNEAMAAHIRKTGGLSHEEVAALRTELKRHYPGKAVNLDSANYDSNYASHYGNIVSLTKRYLDHHRSPAVREHIETTAQQRNRQFGERARPGERW